MNLICVSTFYCGNQTICYISF